MTHADVLDCLSANRRITFLAMLPEEAYKGSRITVGDAENMLLSESLEEEVEDGCPKCGAFVWCEHQDIIQADKEKAELLAEKNEQRHW